MSYIKKLLKLKNLSDLKFEGTAKLEGAGRMELTLRLKWEDNRKLFAGIRYSRGFVNLGEVASGENRFQVEGEGEDFAVLLGDRAGPVGGCSTQNDLWSLYGYCDRLGEIHEKQQEENDPLPEDEEPEAEQAGFDLREMGVTDVLILEDSTVGDDLEPYADVGEDYYRRAKDELRESKMREYFAKIQSLLENNEREPHLENLFPASRFVKIDFDGKGKYYVVGAVYEEERLAYLCYGVPMASAEMPPKFVGVAQYIDCGELGYLLLYQDAETGRMMTSENFGTEGR